jgi:lipoate-protein ligase A
LGNSAFDIRSFFRHSSFDILAELESLNPTTPTSSTPVCRVVIDPAPCSGAWNMAVDETLLESATAGICTVRWYRWEQATLSLGYFQSLHEALADSKLRNLPIVRRLSGGGAIVHHHELTYSCAVPAQHPLAAAPRRLYTAVHKRIIGVLSEFGYVAALRGTGNSLRGNEYLCFGRMDDFDVVMGGHKVLGSAQRRRKGAVLQHGSLVLERSEWAPAFPGVFECGGRSIAVKSLLERLADAVSGLFGWLREHREISEMERQTASRLAVQNSGAVCRGIHDSVKRYGESV